jgi:hypothetical protein
MSNRRRLAREQLEIYLVHLILSYRFLLLISGLALVFFAVGFTLINPLAGYILLLPALLMLLLGTSYNVVVYTARLVAWLATLGKSSD